MQWTGLALLTLYPLFMLFIVGTSGAIKWVDNFGVKILIYVMLGWGLNIVVGLAGLLDLGYVAFYAVGAYAYWDTLQVAKTARRLLADPALDDAEPRQRA